MAGQAGAGRRRMSHSSRALAAQPVTNTVSPAWFSQAAAEGVPARDASKPAGRRARIHRATAGTLP
jgi:hypothetical protein